MHPPTTDERALAYALAVQVAAGNGLRGLLALEALNDPEVAGLLVKLDADGDIDVQLLSRSGMPVAGYSL